MAPKDSQAAFEAEVHAGLSLLPTHGNGKYKQKLLVKDLIADTRSSKC